MVIMVISGTKVISFYGNYVYLWYQGCHFSMVIVVISGAKIIHFIVIMVISGTKVISFCGN